MAPHKDRLLSEPRGVVMPFAAVVMVMASRYRCPLPRQAVLVYAAINRPGCDADRGPRSSSVKFLERFLVLVEVARSRLLVERLRRR
jgi:hypothetical protein